MRTEAYCLAEYGDQYAVFFTGDADRSVDLDLSSANVPPSLRCLKVAETRWEGSETIPQCETGAVSAPGKGHGIAILKRPEQS